MSEVTPYQIAERFIGVKELPGAKNNPFILAMLALDKAGPVSDDIPWCSAFVNLCCWLLRLPRSKSLAARSWLQVGVPIPLEAARPGYDIVVLARDGSPTAGHVGFYVAHDPSVVFLLSGNTKDSVVVAPFSRTRLLGVRRLQG